MVPAGCVGDWHQGKSGIIRGPSGETCRGRPWCAKFGRVSSHQIFFFAHHGRFVGHGGAFGGAWVPVISRPAQHPAREYGSNLISRIRPTNSRPTVRAEPITFAPSPTLLQTGFMPTKRPSGHRSAIWASGHVFAGGNVAGWPRLGEPMAAASTTPYILVHWRLPIALQRAAPVTRPRLWAIIAQICPVQCMSRHTRRPRHIFPSGHH